MVETDLYKMGHSGGCALDEEEPFLLGVLVLRKQLLLLGKHGNYPMFAPLTIKTMLMRNMYRT